MHTSSVMTSCHTNNHYQLGKLPHFHLCDCTRTRSVMTSCHTKDYYQVASFSSARSREILRRLLLCSGDIAVKILVSISVKSRSARSWDIFASYILALLMRFSITVLTCSADYVQRSHQCTLSVQICGRDTFYEQHTGKKKGNRKSIY